MSLLGLVERVPLPWKHGKYFAILVHEVFSEVECKALVDRTESKGYEQALVNIGGGRQQQMDDVRNSDRCIIDDPVTAETIWQRILAKLEPLTVSEKKELRLDLLFHPPSSLGSWTAVGANERLRILKYGAGTYFRPHCDGSYVRGSEAGSDREGETSFVTLQLYLNEGCQGGATRFLKHFDGNSNVSHNVVPKQGSVLLFQHDLLHEGACVHDGLKYVVRTDVMYTTRGEGHEYSVKPLGSQSASDSFEATKDELL